MAKMADYARQEYLRNDNEANSLLDYNRNRAYLQLKADLFMHPFEEIPQYIALFGYVFMLNIIPVFL